MSDAARSPDAQSMREDIAFLRALAEEGAGGPIFGGSILVAAGVIYAAASLAVWCAITQRPSQAGAWMAPIWGGALAAHAGAMAVLILRLKRRGQSMVNRTNRVFARVWNGIGMAILSCLASFFLTAWLARMPEVFAGYPAVILALYGVGWTVTAAASNQRWPWGVAALSFLFAIASGALAGSASLPLLFAAALLALLVAPGAMLIRQARARS